MLYDKRKNEKNSLTHIFSRILVPEKQTATKTIYERQWGDWTQKRNQENVESSFWLYMNFIYTNVFVHLLVHKSRWVNQAIFYKWSKSQDKNLNILTTNRAKIKSTFHHF